MYTKPQIIDLGSLASLTLIGNGKGGSVCDGNSGLTGNRSTGPECDKFPGTKGHGG
jgi:hypothetical protein